jgi:hypothetical protein
MIKNLSTFMATALAVLAFALAPNAAMAQSFSGNWPLSVNHSQRSNGKYCVTLTDDGSLGWPHSGGASVVVGGNPLFGTFQLINHLLTVTFEDPGGTGQNAGLVFVGPAAKGKISSGVYDEVYGGEEFDSGVMLVGKKNGC